MDNLKLYFGLLGSLDQTFSIPYPATLFYIEGANVSILFKNHLNFMKKTFPPNQT